MKTYNTCWSGGLDSTFVVTQLSVFPVAIQPYYIKGQTFRLSEPQELDAISSIRELLIKDPRTKAKILPPIILEKDDSRIKDRDIVQAHRRIYIRLLEKYKREHGGKLLSAGSQQTYVDGAFISPQYIACASLAKSLGERIELGFLKDDFTGSTPVLDMASTVEIDDLETGRKLLRLTEETTDRDLYMLLKDFLFPIAGQGMYKKDVWKWFVDNDYLDIRSKTISCQSPVVHDDGTWEPCGVCNCCIAAIQEGVDEQFTDAGIARYHDYLENHEREPERFLLKAF